MRYTLLLAPILLQAIFAGCQQSASKGSGLHEARFDYNNRRIHLYAARTTDSIGNLLYTDTLGLLCTDRKWRVDSIQNLMSWLYTATKNGRLTLNSDVVNNGSTGFISDSTQLFLHPPRENRYVILEICPFPYLLFPLADNKTWTFDLEVGGHYSNHAVQWKGDETFRSKYQVVADTTIQTPAGLQRCSHIHAINNSRFGISSADFYYNGVNGLVRLCYKPLDRSTIDIAYIKSYYDEALFAAKGLRAATIGTKWDLYGHQ